MTEMRLLLLEPNTVFTARVDQDSFEYPIAEVTYDTGVEFDDVLENYTVFFGTSAGNDDLGRQRLRAGSTISTSGTLKFGRSSLGVLDGEVKLQNDAYITVYELRSVWMKAPFIDDDGTIYKDHDIAYSDQNEDLPPVANAGIGFARSLAGGTSINCDFDGTRSYATADGATISSYLWDVDDGTITVGTVSSSSITANFPVGFRYVTLTVTDSNGKTHSTYVPVYCRDPGSDDTVQTFEITEHRVTAEGQIYGFRVLDDIPASTYPNGTLVMLWEGEPTSNSDRSHMKFIGWHMTDPAEIRAERTGTLKDTVLRCGDRAEMLRRLPGFPVEIISADSPDNWGQMTAPNMDKYLDFLLRWHSTALELGDYTESGTGSDYPFVILGSDGESLWEQVQSKAKALVPDYVLTCNRSGQLAVKADPLLLDAADRVSITTKKALDEGDIRDISWEAQNFPRVHWLRGEAILADADTIDAVFCVAPGEAPGQGLSEQPSGEQLAQSQADLNACEGHRYARLNAPNSHFTITLAGSDDFDIEPADMEWVSVTLGSSVAAQRGLTLSSERGLVREMNIAYERRTGLVKTIELVWEQETEGEPAVTVEYDEDDFPEPDDDPGDDGYDPGPGPGGENDGFGTNYTLYNNVLIRTRDLSAASPDWTLLAGSWSDATDFILDPWRPTTTGYVLEEDGTVWESTDLDQATPSWTKVSTGSGVSAYKIIGSINSDGYFAYVYRSGDQYVRYTTDSWATETDVKYHTSIGAAHPEGAFDYVPHLIGGNVVLYALVDESGSTSDQGVDLHKSTDGGATWSHVSNLGGLGEDGVGHVVCLHCPYDNNASGNILYLGVSNNDASRRGLYRSTDGGVNFSRIRTHHVGIKRHGVETYNQDRQRVHVWDDASAILYLSTDAGGTWSAAAMSGLSGTPVAAGGFPFNGEQYYVVTTAGIFLSTDGGNTWTNKTGDAASINTFSGADRTRAAIVTLWVAE